jgi:hypothetical protein
MEAHIAADSYDPLTPRLTSTRAIKPPATAATTSTIPTPRINCCVERPDTGGIVLATGGASVGGGVGVAGTVGVTAGVLVGSLVGVGVSEAAVSVRMS